MRPILILEINEVPWRLLDLYRDDPRYPSISAFFSRAQTFTNLAVDSGELSPWVTWSTFYRGMNNEKHQIKNLGQDPRSFLGVPLWEEYRKRDLPIGIFGTLQSWPPVEPGPGGFYIPDTFAQDSRCIPLSVEPLQRFNLEQTGQNARIIQKKSLISKSALAFIASLPRLGIRLRTIFKISVQLFNELKDPRHVSKRPVFQTILMWDAFRKLFSVKNPPLLSTFFSNHVAGVMHRSWHELFPEDFKRKPEDVIKSHSMDFAMELLNEILSDAMKWVKRNPRLLVVFASSMGQGAINRDHHQGVELILSRVSDLMLFFKLEGKDYTPLLAMSPQVAVEIRSSEKRAEIQTLLLSCETASGKKLFICTAILDSLSITFISPSRTDLEAKTFRYFREGIAQQAVYSEAGFTEHQIAAGTGYHVPEGAMAVYRSDAAPSSGRSEIRGDKIKDFLMGLAGLN